MFEKILDYKQDEAAQYYEYHVFDLHGKGIRSGLPVVVGKRLLRPRQFPTRPENYAICSDYNRNRIFVLELVQMILHKFLKC